MQTIPVAALYERTPHNGNRNKMAQSGENVSTTSLSLTKSHCDARYVRTFLITTEPAFISRWIRIRPIHGRCSRSAESSRFLKLADCIIGTSASPNVCSVDSLFPQSWAGAEASLFPTRRRAEANVSTISSELIS